jgi:hypothetical protein
MPFQCTVYTTLRESMNDQSVRDPRNRVLGAWGGTRLRKSSAADHVGRLARGNAVTLTLCGVLYWTGASLMYATALAFAGIVAARRFAAPDRRR